jgi:ActR/RegA family two-component response regulator
MRNARILFVDDEPKIVLTMPQVLRQQGYHVTAVESVSDALEQIGTAQFDLLLTDLNIGEQDDGLAVVSAMRRTQPNCLILILTGFPGFDTVLEAMHNQVDEYLIKPAPIPALLGLIEQKLAERVRDRAKPSKRIHEVLRENMFEIVQRALRGMNSDIRIGMLPLSDEQRIEYASNIVENLAALLEAEDSTEIEKVILHDAELQGMRRYQHGYTLPLLAAYMRYLERAILDVIHDYLHSLDPDYFMFDLKHLHTSLGLQLEHMLIGYLDTEEKAGRRPSQLTGA